MKVSEAIEFVEALSQRSDFFNVDGNAMFLVQGAGTNVDAAQKRLNELVSEKSKAQEARSVLRDEMTRLKTINETGGKWTEEDQKVNGKLWSNSNHLYFIIESYDNAIKNQENAVKALEKGGSAFEYKDKRGRTYYVPNFIGVDTSNILFDEETILTDPVPDYIPHMNQEFLERNGFAVDTIETSPGVFLLSTQRYNRSKESPNYFVQVSLDQLTLIVDYYKTKQKAIYKDKAEKSNEYAIERWYKMPIERRKTYLRNVEYKHLSRDQKKKVSEEAFNAMSLEERAEAIPWVKTTKGKRLKEDNSFWTKKGTGYLPGSFHYMFEDFVDPSATPTKGGTSGRVAHVKVSLAWNQLKEALKWKLIDIQQQRQELSDSRQAGIETSFGKSNTDPALVEQFNVLVKRQNGDKITGPYIDQIFDGLVKVQEVFGSLRNLTNKQELVISHSDKRYMYASKAIGVFIPSMNAIGVSGKYGDDQFNDTLAHELAHYIDHELGAPEGNRYLTDNFQSDAFHIADTFRRKLNAQTDNKYLLSTKECFARALQMHFAIETRGIDAAGVYDFAPPKEGKPYQLSDAFISLTAYQSEIKPKIEKFFSSRRDLFPVFTAPKSEPSKETTNNEIMSDNNFIPAEEYAKLPQVLQDKLLAIADDNSLEAIKQLDKEFREHGYSVEYEMPGDVIGFRKLSTSAATKKPETKSGRFSEVIDLDRAKINLDPKRFQGRQGKFSEDTVQAIVSKGSYDRSADPIIVWQDPSTDQYYVISGHSRFEATKQLFESGKQPDLQTVPVKVFNGDEEAAIDYATLESNRGSTEEGLISDIQAFKRAIASGKNKEYLKRIFKPESRLRKLQSLANLNEKGKFLQYLADPSNSSFSYLERNAQWIGQLRDSLPALTDAHENELFDFIYLTKGGNVKKDVLFNEVDKRVNRIDFDQSQPLNLANRASSNAYTDPINDQIKEINKEVEKKQKHIESRRDLIVRARKEGKTELIDKFQKEINETNAFILKKIEERERLKQAIGKMERETVADLFTVEQVETTIEPENIVTKPKDLKTLLNAKEEAAKKKATGKKFNNSQRKAAAAKIRNIVDEAVDNAEELTPEQVIAIAKKINSERSLYSQFVDAKSDSKIQRAPTKKNLETWAKNPGKSDILGVDSDKADKPTLKRDQGFAMRLLRRRRS